MSDPQRTLNIVVPMAGHGARFRDAGYEMPKPLIDVFGRPMIATVIENLRPQRPHRFIFLCQQSHLDDYGLGQTLQRHAPGCEIFGIRRVTAGAACTVLLAKQWIDNKHPLMIANCDQWVETSIDEYLDQGMRYGVDAFLMTMQDQSPKWSYVQRDENDQIMGVVEKEVVSNEATVGIYNFHQGKDFVRHAEQMIREDRRSKGEFYVAPVYSDFIREGMRVETVDVGDAGSTMHGLGTPDDLQRFLLRDRPTSGRANPSKSIEAGSDDSDAHAA